MKKFKFYLWKLKFIEGIPVKKKDIDEHNIPEDVYFNEFTGTYTAFDSKEIDKEELKMYLKVKNAYNFNLIRICIVIFTVFFILAVCRKF